jgi:hypothetical protein
LQSQHNLNSSTKTALQLEASFAFINNGIELSILEFGEVTLAEYSAVSFCPRCLWAS